MNEDVATTHLAQQDMLGGIVEEARIVPGHRPGTPEQEPQDVVPQTGPPSHEQPEEQSSLQPHFLN